jgi:anti-sigma factor RsiW
MGAKAAQEKAKQQSQGVALEPGRIRRVARAVLGLARLRLAARLIPGLRGLAVGTHGGADGERASTVDAKRHRYSWRLWQEIVKIAICEKFGLKNVSAK